MLNLKLLKNTFQSKAFLFCLLFMFCHILTTSAQDIKNFKGVYVLNDTIEGVANLNYFLKNRDTILDGDFNFKSIEEKKEDEFTTYEYEGNFKKDKKDGDWYFKSKSLKLDKDYSISDLQLKSTATGTSTEIFAFFSNGQSDKEWTAIKYKFENSIPKDTLYTIQTNFNSGLLEGKFVSNSKNLNVSGQFSEGLMDGQWVFDDGTHKEKRTFQKGVLTDVEVNDVNIEFIGFDITYDKADEDEKWETIELNETYFEIFNRSKIEIVFSGEYINQSKLQESIKNSNSFIINAFKSFNNTGDFSIWNNLRGSEDFKLPKVKIRKLKYSKKEERQIKSIRENLKLSQTIIKEFRDNSMLEIGKLNFKELNKIELLFSIYKEKFEKLKPALDLIVSPAFEYLKRDELLEAYNVDLEFPETVAYSYDGEVISESYEFPEIEREKFDLEFLSITLESIVNDLKKLDKNAKDDFEKLRKQESLTENEELLIKKREKIETLFDKNKNEDYNGYHDYYSKAVNIFLEDVINDYRKMDLDKKKSEVEILLDCLGKIEKFGEEGLVDFKDRVERVDEEYTRVVFNPFLMSDITERVKERIYKAYEDKLIDYVLENLKNNLSCDSLEDKIGNLEILNESMLKLREKDTKDMERELRRVRDVEQILSLLKIELN